MAPEGKWAFSEDPWITKVRRNSFGDSPGLTCDDIPAADGAARDGGLPESLRGTSAKKSTAYWVSRSLKPSPLHSPFEPAQKVRNSN